ncbi:MAG TPA: cation diffusion facilitator family transporter [Actinomycetota bacterium]|nr:cation diffusion facilitator family transporter [Actinomycetota bacterium]
MTTPERAAAQALAITLALAAAKVAVWAATSSLAVLSQALDSLLDVVALALLLVGVRVAAKPADRSHHYGHAKAENLVAFTQMLLLGGLVVAVVLEAAGRLGSDEAAPTAPWYALALLAISAGVDLWRARALLRASREHRSQALEAGALNVAGDVGTALVALVSLGLVRAGAEGADAVGALIVSAVVVFAGVQVTRRSVDVLMDRAPGGPVEAIQAAAARAAGVTETRRVRVRGSGDHVFADVTVGAGRTASLERAHDIAEAVEAEIEKVAPGTDVVVHVEPAAETSGLVERVQAAASRTTGVHEVHNVSVHAFDEEGRRKLHATLHAKTDQGTSVAEAHDLSDRIEAAVRTELGADARVDTHIEPLQPTSFGRDVTADRPDVVESVRRAAAAESDVVDCHEVLVTQARDRLAVVAHVRGRADLALGLMHEASVRIEKAVHAAHDDVGEVLIHFEPA